MVTLTMILALSFVDSIGNPLIYKALFETRFHEKENDTRCERSRNQSGTIHQVPCRNGDNKPVKMTTWVVLKDIPVNHVHL
ncbi:hypothetical protein ACJMK2_023297, partial [Sinanodonta woodiana]